MYEPSSSEGFTELTGNSNYPGIISGESGSSFKSGALSGNDALELYGQFGESVGRTTGVYSFEENTSTYVVTGSVKVDEFFSGGQRVRVGARYEFGYLEAINGSSADDGIGWYVVGDSQRFPVEGPKVASFSSDQSRIYSSAVESGGTMYGSIDGVSASFSDTT